MRMTLRRWPLAARARLLRLNLIARDKAGDDLARIAATPDWREALERARGGKRILIATTTGGHFALALIDRMLAMALTLRGAETTSVLCDAVLPACQMCELNLLPDVGAFARSGPDKQLCGYCHAPAEARVRELGLAVARLGEALEPSDRAAAAALAHDVEAEALGALTWRGVPVGEHALAGALRFFARGDLEGERHGEAVLRRYVESAALSAAAYLRLIDRIEPEALVAHHGIYTPQGLAAAAARAKGVRVVTWNPAYRRHCFIFSHGDTYHHTLMDEPAESWRARGFSDEERTRISDYLRSRREGGEDWIRFHRDPDYALTADLARLGLDAHKPLVVALTNVFWDAQLHYPANAFPNQAAWLIDTIDYFAARPDLQLAIRVHPAELSGSPPSRQFARDAIAARYPRLPENVKLIGPESALSTYALAERADAALIYGTKMGVELSASGVPVIVAGEAWVRGKGFTRDASSRDDYRAALAELPYGRRLAPEQQELALRYAHHFFFRRMIELPFVKPAPGARRFAVEGGLGMLQPEAWPGLDVICDGILDGAPFVARPSGQAPALTPRDIAI